MIAADSLKGMERTIGPVPPGIEISITRSAESERPARLATVHAIISHIPNRNCIMEGIERFETEKNSALTLEEQQFLDDFGQRLDSLIQNVHDHPRGEVRGLLSQLFRPAAWKVLLELNKAEGVVAKAGQGDQGDATEYRLEADALNAEYDRRASAAQRAIQEFAEFIDGVNDRKG